MSKTESIKIRKINEHITIFSRPFTKFGILPIGGRSVAVKLSNGSVWLLASTPPTEETKKAINEMGPVAYIVAPNIEHHWFLEPFKQIYPSAKLIGPGALGEKRKDLKWDGLYMSDPEDTTYGFEDDIIAVPFSGTIMAEVAYYHKHTKTLIVGDLLFNLPNTESMPGSLNFLWKAFTPGKSLHAKIVAGAVKNREALAAEARKVDSLNIQRIIPLHGDVIESDAHERWKQAYAAFL